MTDRSRLYITDVHQPSVNRLLAELAERDAIIAKVVDTLEWFAKQELSIHSVQVVLDLSAELQRAVTR